MTPALKARILANWTNDTQANATQVNATPANATPARTALANVTATQVPLPSIEPKSVEPTKPAQYLSQSIIIDDLPAIQEPPPSSPLPEDDISDTISFTSTISDFFEVGDDDSGPLVTGPWTIIDHFTGDVTTDDAMIVDEEEDPPAAPAAPFDFTIQVQLNPILGVPALVQTLPPTLLFRDHDERPDWLIRSTNELLHPTSYYMCLNKVVDLFFAQEARLGYPDKVSPLWLSLFIAH